MLQERKDFYYEEDEISLYDIIDILKKYWKAIITIFLIGSILSFVFALGFRNYNRKESASQKFYLNYPILEKNPYYQMLNLSYIKFDPMSILQNEKYIDKFFEIEELNKEFEKSEIADKDLLLSEKIKFLSKFLSIKKDGDNYEVKVTANRELKISEKIIQMYFFILENEISNKMKELIEIQKEEAEYLNTYALKELETIKEKINLALKEEHGTNMTAEDIRSLIAFKEPVLNVDNIYYQSVYDRTSKQIAGAEGLLNTGLVDKLLEKTTSLIIKRESGIAKYILLGGFLFTCFIIIMFIVLKEFLEGYRQHKLDREQKKLK